jgi:hypothetical protein
MINKKKEKRSEVRSSIACDPSREFAANSGEYLMQSKYM